jgi:hypothetical protein
VRRTLFGAVFLAATLIATVPAATSVAGTDVATGLLGFEPTNGVVNPLNPAQIAVARGCTVVISNNFGQDNFPVIRNTSLAGCSGDASMAFDSQGQLFISHLSRSFGAGELTVVAGLIADTTTPGTATYTPVQVSQTDGNDDDKNWLAADANPTSPFADNLYLVWTRFTGINAGGPTAIFFSRSTDGGANWSAPGQLDTGAEGFVWPSHTAVAQNGDVYVAYHTSTCGAANTGTIPLLRDGTGGASFAAGVVPQRNNAFGAGQATVTCNDQDGSGDEIPGTDFWLQGTVQPWILPDPVRPGNVYVVGNDDPNNAYANGDDGDVVIARSTDFGVTFSRSRLDHGPGQSFSVMPTAHIDQDGNVVATWYDNRAGVLNSGANGNGSPNFLLELYATTSRDGALSWTNDFRVSDNFFDPDAGSGCRFGSKAGGDCAERIGEYNGVYTVDGIGYAAWTGNATPPVPPGTIDGAGAQTTYADVFSMLGAFSDRFEPNESIDGAVVAQLGADDTFNEERLTLHTATDVDFFKVTALHTGMLEAEIAFNEVIADLAVIAQDAAGNTLATGSQATSQPGSSTETLAIPVVLGETYFVEVLNPNGTTTFPPQSVYDLTIVNRAAPVPFGLDLLASSDTGRSNTDNETSDDTPSILIRADTVDSASMGIDLLDPAEVAAGEDGYAVAAFANGVFAGYASEQAGTSGTAWVFTFPPLPDGTHSLTAKVRVFDGAAPQANGFGGESAALTVTIDTVAPPVPAAPDLLAASDSGGISDDDITTIQAPAFQGAFVEPNALVRIRANGAVVGQGLVTSLGNYQVIVDPLADDVYLITAELEDLAGNVSVDSDALKVTIAHDSLNLPGDTSGPASATVVVDLQAGTVAGYPGVAGSTGLVGIVGIPTVNLDANGQDLEILGTAGDDSLVYQPTSETGGRLTRAGSAQVITFSDVNPGSTFTIDPGAGTDEVIVLGTPLGDAIQGVADTTSTVQVGSLLMVHMPTASTELVGIWSGPGVDTVTVTAFDTVNSSWLVDGGSPSTNPHRGDKLLVGDGSGGGKILIQPSSIQGAGLAFVDYDKTTGALTTIGYVNIESAKKATGGGGGGGGP